MAYELFPHPHGNIFRGVLEPTPGGTVTVADANVKHWPEDGTFNSFVRSMQSRTNIAAFGPGAKPTKGYAVGQYAANIMLDHKALPGATVLDPVGSIANVPEADLWLRAGGFQGTYTEDSDYSGLLPDTVVASAGSNDRILTYIFEPRSGAAISSAKLQYDQISEDRSKARRHVITSARHGWTLSFPNGEAAVMAIEGKGFATPIAIVASPTTDSALPDEEEIVGLAGNTSLTAVVDAVTYGKDSDTAAASQLQSKQITISNLEISSGLTAQEYLGPTGTEGVASIRYVFTRPTATFRLDMVPFEDDFNIESFRDNRRILSYAFVLANPLAPTTSFNRWAFSGHITNIEYGNADGYQHADITMDLSYPDSSSDGGGLVPTNLLTCQYVTIVPAP